MEESVVPPAVHGGRHQATLVHQIVQPWPCLAEADPVVVSQVGSRPHPVATSCLLQQIGLGVGFRGGGTLPDGSRNDLVEHHVCALEVPDPPAPHVAHPEQPVHGPLAVRASVPPGPGPGTGVGEVGSGDRPPAHHLVEDGGHVVGPLLGQGGQASPRLARPGPGPEPPQRGFPVDGQDRCLV